MRQPVLNLRLPHPLILVSQRWPCWLPTISALGLPLAGAYFPAKYHKYFTHDPSEDTSNTEEFGIPGGFLDGSVGVEGHCLLLSGSLSFILQALALHRESTSPVIACVEAYFPASKAYELDRMRRNQERRLQELGLETTLMSHSDFGGATNASHLVCFRGLHSPAFQPGPCTPRVLKHLLNSASKGRYTPIDEPASLQGEVDRVPVRVDGLLRGEGLLDVHEPLQLLACPSVFSHTRWVKRTLSESEKLRAFDLPVSMDHRFQALPPDIVRVVSPLVVTTVFRALWSDSKGGLKVRTGRRVSDLQVSKARVQNALPLREESSDSSSVDTSSIDSPPHLVERDAESLMSSDSSGAESSVPDLRIKDDASIDDDSSSSDDDSSSATPHESIESPSVIHLEEVDDWSLGSWRHTVLEEEKGRGERSREGDSLSLVTGESLDLSPKFRPQVKVDFSHIPELAVGRSSVLDSHREEEYKGTSSIMNHPGESPGVHDRGSHVTASPSLGKLKRIKQEHDLAKAVKADDAEVPVHLWDEIVCRGKPSNNQVKALFNLRKLMLHRYRRSLLSDCLAYLRKTHGKSWHSTKRKQNDRLDLDVQAMRDIIWRGTENDWFEYPGGSRLKYFRFPIKYRKIARDGAPVFFVGPAPTAMRAQPPMKEDEQKVLREKLVKMIRKRYMDVPEEMVRSWIYYFGVPKGSTDWRVVYHAGANGLNDCVWTPSFWLPKIDSLLRIVDNHSVMEDRDIGEMFINFQLAPPIRRYTRVDLGPLELSKEQCPSKVVSWNRNLMGFKSSPYNSVRMYLIAEEIIRGDPGDATNPFQWEYVQLNLPGQKDYQPNIAWITKRRKDGSLASDFVCFVDDQRLGASNSKRMREAGHALSTREAYLGLQDALRKLRSAGGTRWPGAWAGVVVFTEEGGVVLLTSQEKWDRLKAICTKWLDLLELGEEMLVHKELLSDRGFLVYVTAAYPPMVPYLKGIHLTLETWRGGRDEEGWKVKPTKQEEESVSDDDSWTVVEGVDEETIRLEEATHVPPPTGPDSGLTQAVPRMKNDLKALLELAASETPRQRVIRAKNIVTAYYGFGDASSGGFGASIERPGGIHGRYGIWGRDEDNSSSNFRELLNLVETVEEEAAMGHLRDCELWLFTDNSTAESCFAKGSSSSKLLHELVLRLRKAEMAAGFTLHLVHVAGTRMIAQGTDGLSRGVLLEGVLAGKDMLSFVDLAKTALERSPQLLEYVRSWTERPKLKALSPEEWFTRGHGMIGGNKDSHGIWIPDHAPNGETYLWSPPPIVADVALEECLKAIHKRRDAYHVFLIPRLFGPKWIRLFYKLCDFIVRVPAGSPIWPSDMHEPLWIGISLPFVQHRPWTLRGTPLLVELERDMRRVQAAGEGDGRDILRQLLRVPRRVSSVSLLRARQMLHLPAAEGSTSAEASNRRGK